MSAALDRRKFLAIAASSVVATPATFAAPIRGPKLKKAIKYGMIQHKGSIAEKLALAKRVGFAGVEIDSPSDLDLEEANRAQDSTGVKIHGVVDSIHWRETLSSPSPEVREKGRLGLVKALQDAATVKADTVLLVPGVVNKEVTFEDCRQRSQAEIRKVLPQAEQLGVKIAIEVVWNNFITKPEQLVEYVDDFKSPWVGAYFDCSNMIKYGVTPANWIRKLGKRMLKFDFKGYSHSKQWVKIGEGDEDWPEILRALEEIGYEGWATAEVGGGGESELRDISRRMDRCLGFA